MKVALLSNINADYVLQLLEKKIECVASVGYGDVWGQLLDPNSNLNHANPNVIVLLNDIEQLIDGYDFKKATSVIDEWFTMFDSIVHQEKDYFISDIMFRSEVLADNDSFFEYSIIHYWMDALEKRVKTHVNVHLLTLSSEIAQVGKEKVFSSKMWFMGKIPYTNEGCKLIASAIERTILLLNRTNKKVLVLDLDNTLWGGILGELGIEGIMLSDEKIGSIYKKIQQQIKDIKETGVLLAIVSKNNDSDVDEVWDKQPHMLLKREDFASIKINWRDKAENLIEIAKELNLGIDSFVFIDDTASERDNIRMRIPEIAVPEFPQKIENYPSFILDIYNCYFKRCRLSAEDKVKTQQYAENAMRERASQGISYEEFLLSLKLVVKRVEINEAKLDRIAQMHGKTNQFNLTTIRYTRQDLDKLLSDGYKIYAYNVKDKFGDYGLVAAAIIDCRKPEINSFLMSCRIMGKLVENYVIDDIENDLLKKGHVELYAKYVKTAKNNPVTSFFDGLGYSVVAKSNEETYYKINLLSRPKRKYFVNKNEEET